MFRPQKAAQMTTPCMLQLPIEDRSGDALEICYLDMNYVFHSNFSTYGSSEHESNGVLIVEENTTVTTWYNQDIVAGCRIKRLTDGAIFEIIGEPENVEMRNLYTVCKVRRVRGVRIWVKY